MRLLWGYFIQLKTNFLVLKMKTRVLLFSRENVLTKYEQKKKNRALFLSPASPGLSRKENVGGALSLVKCSWPEGALIPEDQFL